MWWIRHHTCINLCQSISFTRLTKLTFFQPRCASRKPQACRIPLMAYKELFLPQQNQLGKRDLRLAKTARRGMLNSGTNTEYTEIIFLSSMNKIIVHILWQTAEATKLTSTVLVLWLLTVTDLRILNSGYMYSII